jgi:cellobiose-specific phosphotransferase system component IIC
MTKIKFIWQDWLIIAGVVSNLFAHFFTNYIESSIKTLVATAQAVEANPAQRALQTTYYLQVGMIAIVYAILMALYLHQRSQRDKKPYGRMALNVFAFMVFLLFLYDSIGDFGIVVALLIK